FTAVDEGALTPLQQQVIACIKQLFALNEVGIDSNLFGDLGLSSLDYLALAEEIKSTFGVDVTKQVLSTPGQIAELVALQ
ncbi:MAG: acyl carrier protein, partial [Clostridia bacterium]|nr:acyl carrier protein [Clostridia bacterium]